MRTERTGMGVGEEQWLGPGETARRLGVTTKALRVYERETLVVPHRAPSGWRLYGPAEIARLHQIIVLRDFGLSLAAIRTVLGRPSGLADVLQLQRESLQLQQEKIRRALLRIDAAQRGLAEGRDLSLNDVMALAEETVLHQSSTDGGFAERLEALVAEQDPSGQAGRAFAELRDDARVRIDGAGKAALSSMLAEARQLKEAGDVDSEAAKDFIRRFEALVAGVRRPPPSAKILDAFKKTVAEAKSRSQTLPFDPEVLAFLARVKRGMRDRGELA